MPKYDSTLTRWLQERRQLGDKVITLEGDINNDNSGVFQVTSGYLVGQVGVSNYPRYYVWYKDEMVWHTSSYNEAYIAWNKYTKRCESGVA